MNILLEYDKINDHLQISKDLHRINMKGKCILHQLEKKNIRIKRTGTFVFNTEIGIVYNAIVDITNIKRFNKLRLFFCIQYYLDELLYRQVRNLDHFTIEDDEYKLPDIYFNQNLWNPIDENDLSIYNFAGNEKQFLDEEIKFIKLYFKEYTFFLDDIKARLNNVNGIESIKFKLTRIFNRILRKLEKIDEFLDRL